MTTERLLRVVYVETNRDEEDVRFTFSQCGEIRAIYPFKTGDRYKSVHYFVEFDQSASVKRAKAVQLREVKVHAIGHLPELIDHFVALAPPSVECPAVDKKPPLDSHGLPVRLWSQPGKPYSPKSSVGKKHRKAGRTQTQSHWSWGFRSDSPADQNKENEHGVVTSSALTTLPMLLNGAPAASLTNPVSESGQVKTESVPNSPLRRASHTPQNANLPPRPQSPPHTTTSPFIVLSYGGDRFHCCLDQLTDDPDNVITLLTQTCAQALERDKWMIVAGYYRSKGNVQAALSVITAMVNVLSSAAVGLSEAELRPAFLMLASCHSDLSKSASPDLAKEYMSKAQDYLRKVYGADVPGVVGTVAASTRSVRVQHAHRGHFANTSNMPAADASRRMEDKRRDNSQRKGASDDGKMCLLEREVQSLRDRHGNAMANLAQARAAKRQLEDDLADERNTRRKVERDLEDAIAELSGARRGEKYALEQCKREVDSRRRIEERAVGLRDEMTVLRRELDAKDKEVGERDRRARDTFGQLGELFMRASRGEMDLTSGWARSFHSQPSSSMAPPSVTPRRERTTSAASRSDERPGTA